MKTLSMEKFLEDKRRAVYAARNLQLAEQLRQDGSFEGAFARLCAMQGLTAPAMRQEAPV